jgi:hypothetical protein
LKELEDHSWFPVSLRNFQTEFIGYVVSKFNIYNGFVKYLNKLSLPVQTMTDLCSGSGQPAIGIFTKSNCFNRLVLTDKYPNVLFTQDERITYDAKSIDVLQMVFKPNQCYTMFNAFHHFEDKDKLKIVQKIKESGSSAFFVEILEPRVDCLLKIFLTTTIGTIIFTPFLKPFSFKRLLFTYIIPINIFTIAMDGIISVFKARSLKHYQKLFTKIDDLKVVRLNNGLTPIILIQIH